MRTLVVVTLAMVSALAASATAHHSFAAEYDQAKPIHIEGIVTRLELRNPHAVLEVASRDASGAAITWAFEMGAPGVLTRRLGWSVDSVKAGDRVTVEAAPARSGGQRAAALVVSTAAGVRLRAVLPFK